MDWYSPPLLISQDSVSFQRRADTDWRLQGLAWFSCCLPLVLSQCWFSGVGTCSIDFGRTSVFVTDLEPWPPRAYRGHLSDWRQEPPACGHSHAPRAEWKSECSCTPLQEAPWHRSNLHTHSWGPCHGHCLSRTFPLPLFLYFKVKCCGPAQSSQTPLLFGGASSASGSLSHQRPWGVCIVIFSLGLINPGSSELDPGTEAARSWDRGCLQMDTKTHEYIDSPVARVGA